MNLLCPNCQKPLQVPEQYAGQLMKCPLCQGTFGVPAMPPPPSPAAPPPPPETFTPAPEPPRPNGAASAPAKAAEAPAPPPPPPPPPATGYERSFSLSLKPQVLVWIAPAALALIFVLLFFPWNSTYELNPKEWYSQLGWGTGFGREGSFLGILYILLLFPVFAVALASAVLPLLPIKFPPQVEALLPWRAALVAVVILLPTLLLLSQLTVFGFGLENVVLTTGEGSPAKDAPDDLKTRLMKSEEARKVARETLRRSTCLNLVLLLHAIALAGAGLDAWLQRRGPSRLPPRVDLLW